MSSNANGIVMDGEISSDGMVSSKNVDFDTQRPPSRSIDTCLLPDVDPKAMLNLNIGGFPYKIRIVSVLSYGQRTLLGKLISLPQAERVEWCDCYFAETDEYFFERPPLSFGPIYEYLVTGSLHVPQNVCFDKFMQELQFWNISKTKLDKKCSPFTRFYESLYVRSRSLDSENFGDSKIERYRHRLHLIFEGAEKSTFWEFFEKISITFVIISIVALLLGSMEMFQMARQNVKTPDDNEFTKGTTITKHTVIIDGYEHFMDPEEHWMLYWIEKICVIYFAFEYMLRLWVAPNRSAFIKKFINVIDVLTILPFIFEVMFFVVGIDGDNIRKIRWAVLTVRLLRVMKVFRIVKLGRFSNGMTNFGQTLLDSKKQLEMILITLFTVILFFSTLIYFLEKDEPNTEYTSIPMASFYTFMSMTTTGGTTPLTPAGKFISTLTIGSGIMVFALPITILVSNFIDVVKIKDEKIIKKYIDI
uniref:BTB domain-containing protein n=1 Tax=Rhabditophanes sp. KR3021 TaxID=114890 RepID=A0AC35TNB3_9BILA